MIVAFSLIQPRVVFLCNACVFGLFSLNGCKPHDSKISVSSVENKKVAAGVSFANTSLDVFDHCTFSNGREAGLASILEIVGGGVGCIDYDNDGVVDLLFPRGGTIDVLEKQVEGVNASLLRGFGQGIFVISTEQTRVQTDSIYSHGISSVDYDHDGFEDLLVYGYGGVILYQNLGDGTFLNVTEESGLGRTKWVTAAAWLDLDADQNLDLYLGSYVDWNFDNHPVQ